MINRLLTWMKANDKERELIKAARMKQVYIITRYYHYRISKIIINTSNVYVLHLADRKPAIGVLDIDLEDYELAHEPETTIYLSGPEFSLMVVKAMWNTTKDHVVLTHDIL